MGSGEGPFRQVAQIDQYDRVLKEAQTKGYTYIFLNNDQAVVKDFTDKLKSKDPGKRFEIVPKGVAEDGTLKIAIYYKPAKLKAQDLVRSASTAKGGVYKFEGLQKEEMAFGIVNNINLHKGYAAAVWYNPDGSVNAIYVLNLSKFKELRLETDPGKVDQAGGIDKVLTDLVALAKKQGIKLKFESGAEIDEGTHLSLWWRKISRAK